MKRAISAAIFVVASIPGTEAFAACATGNAPAPAVYLVPHQDDETLSMSVDIRSHLEAGRPVEVYLFTNGGGTFVCGRAFGLNFTRAECTEQRDREFASATTLLGVASSHVHYVKDPATGQRPNDVPSEVAADRMLTWIINDIKSRYPSSWQCTSWKTMSWSDNHEGHAVMGASLRAAYQDGRVDDVRFFLKRRADGGWPSIPSGSNKRFTEALPPSSRSGKRIWMATYSYGIGNASVTSEFQYQRSDPRSIVHNATR